MFLFYTKDLKNLVLNLVYFGNCLFNHEINLFFFFTQWCSQTDSSSIHQPDSKPNLYTQSRAFDRISFYFPISRLQVCEKDGYYMSWAVNLVNHIHRSLSSAHEKSDFIEKLENKFSEITRELLYSFSTGDFGYFYWKWILDRNLLNSEVHVEKKKTWIGNTSWIIVVIYSILYQIGVR